MVDDALKWPRLKRDYTGKLVRLTKRIESTGGNIFEVGTVMRVTSWHRGLSLSRVVICDLCQCLWRGKVSQIGLGYVELLPDDHPIEGGPINGEV